MKKNMGTTDTMIRLLAAALIVVLFITNVLSGTLAIVLLVVAGLLVITSIFSFCPMYWPFGISTRREKV